MADYWMKLYIEILDDPKMATLPDRVWRRVIELFLVAKRLGKVGHLPETRQIAWMLRMNPDELESDMSQIAMTGIVIKETGGWFIPKFQARQEAVSAKERKQQERTREQSQQYYGDVTNQSRNVTQSTESDNRVQITETETDAEADVSPDPYFSSNPLSVAFESESHIAAPGNNPKLWIEACNKMSDLGIVASDVKQATYQLIKKGYTVVGPSSVVNAAINVMARRKQGPNPEEAPRRPKRDVDGNLCNDNGDPL